MRDKIIEFFDLDEDTNLKDLAYVIIVGHVVVGILFTLYLLWLRG